MPLVESVTTRIPYKPIGTWIDGWVPDSIRYVPGSRAGPLDPQAPQQSVCAAPLATSVPNDWTRFPCAGGCALDGAAPPAIGHVWARTPLWSGLVVEVGAPRPPPIWPTITSEVGTVLLAVDGPVGNDRLFVKVI